MAKNVGTKTDKHAANENKRRLAGKANRESGSGRSGYSQRIKEKKLSEGSKARGCGTKLFMVVVPFVTVGAYLLFN